jgi:hypothetical protein
MHRRPVLRRRQKDRWIVRGEGQSLTSHVVESLVTGIGPLPTPDQNLIDATGRAFGIENADGGALRTSSELLDARDGNAAANKPRERQRL